MKRDESGYVSETAPYVELVTQFTNPERYVETFVAESWADHLQQRERVTAEDACR